jgi:phospholipase C
VITASNGNVRKAHEDLRDPHGVTVTPDGSQAYMADSRNDRVVVLDTTTLRRVGRIAVGRTPWSTAFTADGSSAYVTNANDDTVSVIDTSTRKVTETIALGAGNHIPTVIVMSAADTAWATCNASSSIAVIDTSSNNVVETIAIRLGDDPTGIAFT